MQTVVEVASEKNSTLVLPFPVELLRFLDRAERPHPEQTEQHSPPPANVADRDLPEQAGSPEPAGSEVPEYVPSMTDASGTPAS